MTSTLTWRPALTDKEDLPDELKFVLRKKFNGNIHEQRLDMSDVKYLEGLVDAGVKGANSLINAIQINAEVIITEEY